ncbi:hypothetical protein Hdeb2414_s0010g00337991 [Helianthus debilis subsp. tardiflorus]
MFRFKIRVLGSVRSTKLKHDQIWCNGSDSGRLRFSFAGPFWFGSRIGQPSQLCLYWSTHRVNSVSNFSDGFGSTQSNSAQLGIFRYDSVRFKCGFRVKSVKLGRTESTWSTQSTELVNSVDSVNSANARREDGNIVECTLASLVLETTLRSRN